jgi:mono/diheme cytochrome c family protein
VRIALVSILVVIAAVAAGCGAVKRVSSGDPAKGKVLFVQKCGSCHVLAAANTQGTVGPNLDNAFGPDKEQGFDYSTIADVVRGQIAYPDTKPSTGLPGMTANLLHGQDARDVSVFVAQCAAKPDCVPKAGTVNVEDLGR